MKGKEREEKILEADSILYIPSLRYGKSGSRTFFKISKRLRNFRPIPLDRLSSLKGWQLSIGKLVQILRYLQAIDIYVAPLNLLFFVSKQDTDEIFPGEGKKWWNTSFSYFIFTKRYISHRYNIVQILEFLGIPNVLGRIENKKKLFLFLDGWIRKRDWTPISRKRAWRPAKGSN